MQERGPTYHASTPSEGTRSIAPVTRSTRPSARAAAAQPKSIGFFGVSFVIVSFGIAIGAATVGMHELLDQRSARAAAAGSHAPAAAATSLPGAAGSSAADADGGVAPGTAAATPADPTGTGKAKGRFHPRRIGPAHRPGEGSSKHPGPVPPPNPYDDALE